MRHPLQLCVVFSAGFVLLAGLGVGVCAAEGLAKNGAAHGKSWCPAWYGYFPTCWRAWPVPGGRMANLASASCPAVSESGLPAATEPFRAEPPASAPGAVSEMSSAPLPPTPTPPRRPGTSGASDLPSVRTPPAVAPRPATRDD